MHRRADVLAVPADDIVCFARIEETPVRSDDGSYRGPLRRPCTDAKHCCIARYTVFVPRDMSDALVVPLELILDTVRKATEDLVGPGFAT